MGKAISPHFSIPIVPGTLLVHGRHDEEWGGLYYVMLIITHFPENCSRGLLFVSSRSCIQ
ncbi:hypothetical protein K443DRAFT_675260 [Laccaria amethystina LaAM-08-1]|uniref:Uncharacterized protein n=1 Tax=Laccaria amethystina LaAM-08-1 TaxID=1095629 RepID=A0A0C9WZQ4_9AGAR|nr:hypothetical protein K443DRAFT_675260 [Laccaria amethystina LaAM-08-1]